MLKGGVRLLGIRPEMIVALMVAQNVYSRAGAALVITSVTEGTHKRASKHYTGCAADLRTFNLAADIVGNVVASLVGELGPDFDVVLEADHIHIEFDPKSPY
jgi:hypothetical protein